MLTRRSFLRKTAAAAAVSAPFFVAKDLFAYGSPNDKINVGLIGLGKMMNSHLGGLLSDKSIQITSICDVDDERLDYNKVRIEKYYKSSLNKDIQIKTHKDFRELLADKSVDAMFIVTPDHWHAIMAILAARAGKHIYCEKPLAFSVQEDEQIVKAVKASGVVFQTGSQQRSEESFRTLAQMGRTGMLGDIESIWCNVLWKFPVVYNWEAEETPKGVDWEMWTGPAPLRPYSKYLLPPLNPGNDKYNYPWGEWRWHSDFGNGRQGDWGAHHFDIAQWGLNMDGKGPKYVHVSQEQNPTLPDDKRCISYEYANGTKVHYGFPSKKLTDVKCPIGAPMITFVGSKGLACASRGPIFWSTMGDLNQIKIPFEQKASYVSQGHRDNFFDAIRTGRPTICPAEIGASTCNMCIIGNIAHKLGRRLEYDWQKREFVGDATANRYLWRENRGEWARVI